MPLGGLLTAGLTAGIGGLIGGLGSKNKNKQQQQSSQTGNFDQTAGSTNKINQFGSSDQNLNQLINSLQNTRSSQVGQFLQQNNQTERPLFTGQQGGIQGDLYSQLHSALASPMGASPLFDALKSGAIGQLNQAYQGAQQGQAAQLAGRGFGRSGMLPQNSQQLESQRLGGIGGLQSQFAGLQLDQYNKTLQDALNYAFAAPGRRTTGTTSGTSSMTGNQQTTGMQQMTGHNTDTQHNTGVSTGFQHQLGSNQSNMTGSASGQQGGNAAAGALTGAFGGLNAQPGGFGGFINSLSGLGAGNGGQPISAYSLPVSSNAQPPQTLPNLPPDQNWSTPVAGMPMFLH